MQQNGMRLATGQTIPRIGFGTWELLPDEVAKKAVLIAFEAGYRLVDTAKIYDNERGIGAAIRESDIPRSDLFITTKLWNSDQGYDSAIEACNASLERLGLEYVDLYLIHWPASSRRNESWRALVELQRQGKTKQIGVSNYTVRHLEELVSESGVFPSVNQIEFHPFIYEQQKSLLDFCKKHHIVIEAYSPIARVTENLPVLVKRIADTVGKSPIQVVLRWCIEHGTVPLPRSRSPKHIKTNFEVFDFELGSEAVRSLDSMSDGEWVNWDPAGMA